MKQTDTDFGWRYKGRWVGEYRDLSREGVPDAHLEVDHHHVSEKTRTCLQCGVCTATCHLAKDDGRFPRREMSLVQGGLAAHAAKMSSIWQCYQCDDCTAGCPSLAGPSEVMAQLRTKATVNLSVFPDFARMINTWEGFAVFSLFAFFMIAILGINFSNHVWERDTVVFSAMYPHSLLIPLFSVLTFLSFILIFISLAKAWRTWSGATPAIPHVDGRILGRSIFRAIHESIRHTRFDACDANRYRRYAHILIVVGFAGLCGIALFAAVLPFIDASPKTFQAPFTAFKLTANVFSWVMIAGIGMFLFYHFSQLRNKTAVVFSDWMFPVLLLMVAVTGLVSQWARWSNIGVIAYTAYLFHLSSVFVLIVILPFAKPAHALYRLAAEVHRIYSEMTTSQHASDECDEIRVIQSQSENRRETPPSNTVDFSLVSNTPYLLLHEDVEQLPDTVIVSAYNTLRDSYEKVGDEKRYINIENLYCTAFEREKDRRELARRQKVNASSEFIEWYEEAAKNPCGWWLKHHLLARHSLKSCMFCGMCTSVCPASEYYMEYNPRSIADVALSENETEIVALLKSDVIWYCGQCGSCKERCPRGNSIMGLISSLRILSQLKGYHLYSNRGRQQYASRHLWGANFWNRGCSLYFRNADKWAHPDFGPNYGKFFDHQEQEFLRLGANPDRPGMFGGRKIHPETLEELRLLVEAGGTLCLWKKVDDSGHIHRRRLDLSEDAYLEMVAKEG
jgi:heterodisulfide reductase subunit C1